MIHVTIGDATSQGISADKRCIRLPADLLPLLWIGEVAQPAFAEPELPSRAPALGIDLRSSALCNGLFSGDSVDMIGSSDCLALAGGGCVDLAHGSAATRLSVTSSKAIPPDGVLAASLRGIHLWKPTDDGAGAGGSKTEVSLIASGGDGVREVSTVGADDVRLRLAVRP
jgi:hypothetical protein